MCTYQVRWAGADVSECHNLRKICEYSSLSDSVQTEANKINNSKQLSLMFTVIEDDI